MYVVPVSVLVVSVDELLKVVVDPVLVVVDSGEVPGSVFVVLLPVVVEPVEELVLAIFVSVVVTELVDDPLDVVPVLVVLP